jgi:hypothetical protein
VHLEESPSCDMPHAVAKLRHGETFPEECSNHPATAPDVQRTKSCHPNYTLQVMDVAIVICKG